MLSWDCNMELGVRTIDAQHKRLIDFMNLINNARSGKLDLIITNKMVATLRTLFQQHFLHEEDLMFGVRYPEANQHMLEHSTMLNTFDAIAIEFEKTGDTSTVLTFVTNWIFAHFKNEDSDLVAFIKKLKESKAKSAKPHMRPPAPPQAVRAMKW